MVPGEHRGGFYADLAVSTVVTPADGPLGLFASSRGVLVQGRANMEGKRISIYVDVLGVG
jgi:hypothetical protein